MNTNQPHGASGKFTTRSHASQERRERKRERERQEEATKQERAWLLARTRTQSQAQTQEQEQEQVQVVAALPVRPWLASRPICHDCNEPSEPGRTRCAFHLDLAALRARLRTDAKQVKKTAAERKRERLDESKLRPLRLRGNRCSHCGRFGHDKRLCLILVQLGPKSIKRSHSPEPLGTSPSAPTGHDILSG